MQRVSDERGQVVHIHFAQDFAYIYRNLTSMAGPEAERINGKSIFRGETVGTQAVIVIASSCNLHQ